MLATTTGINGWAYLLVLSLHLLCVILGFGSVLLMGIWGSAQGKLTGEAADAIGRPMAVVSKIADIAILLVPVFGIGAISLSSKAYTFKDAWVSASLGLYFVGLGVSYGVLHPAIKQLAPLTVSSAPGSPERVALEKKVAASSGVLHLVFVVVLLLMVFGPYTSWLRG